MTDKLHSLPPGGQGAEPLDLRPIKAREAAATKGPWKVSTDYSGPEDGGLPTGYGRVYSSSRDDEIVGYTNIEECEFIAHARQDIPALLAEVERLRSVVSGLSRPPVAELVLDTRSCLCPNGHGQMAYVADSPLAPGAKSGGSWVCGTCKIERMWPDPEDAVVEMPKDFVPNRDDYILQEQYVKKLEQELATLRVSRPPVAGAWQQRALVERWRSEVGRNYDVAVDAAGDRAAEGTNTASPFHRGVALGRSLCAKELEALLPSAPDQEQDT